MLTNDPHVRSGIFVIVDGVEIGLTVVFAAVLAVIVTLGKKETCDSLEDLYEDIVGERLVAAGYLLY